VCVYKCKCNVCPFEFNVYFDEIVVKKILIKI